MLSLAKFLDNKKFWVGVACSKHASLDNWCKKIQDAGIPVFRLNVKHKHDPRHFFGLRKIIRNEHIDLLHIHAWNPASGRYGFLAALSQKLQHLVTEHDPFALPPFKNWLKKKLMKNIQAVIAVSEENRNLLISLYPHLEQKIHAIHNGIDTTWFESQLLSFSRSDREEYKKDIFETDESTPIIIAVAELHPRKGLVYLLDAARILAEKKKKFKIIIVGDGHQRKELENFIENVKLEPYVELLGKRSDIPYLLKASDVFVLPSMHEAFGLVLLEAMMAELPVIATSRGGVPEIITHGESGILIEPRNSQAIANAIENLIDDPEMAKKISKAGQKRAREKFDLKRMVEETEDLYSKILS
jgi:glycosyltransferase involved in cell wall biosynthesis